MPRWEFHTKLFRPEGVGTWTLAPVPVELAKETGVRAGLRVKGSMDGVAFSCTLLPAGRGRHFIVVKKELRDKIGKGAGDRVKVSMTLDSSPVVIKVPGDLSRALDSNKKAKAFFEEIAPSHKKNYLAWVVGAKRPETRERRIAKTVEMLAKGVLLK